MKRNVLLVVPFVLFILFTIIGLVRYETGCNDVYIYGVPANARFSYMDIPMYECSWCHRTKNLNRHHLVPQSADIRLKDDANNIVVLCRDCHFVLGHRCNWKQFNPDVMEIVNTYTNIIKSKIYNEELGLTNVVSECEITNETPQNVTSGMSL